MVQNIEEFGPELQPSRFFPMDVEFRADGKVPLPSPESPEHVSSQCPLELVSTRVGSRIGQRRAVERLSAWILGPVEIQWLSRNKIGTENGGISVSSKKDRKSTRLNSSHSQISYAVFCLKKKNRYV